MTKTTPGNSFEDFRLGQTIRHATPPTVTLADLARYHAPGGPGPDLPQAAERRALAGACPVVVTRQYDFALAGSPHRFRDYQAGEKIDRIDGMTVEEAEHQMATPIYQNTARVHFDQFPQ